MPRLPLCENRRRGARRSRDAAGVISITRSSRFRALVSRHVRLYAFMRISDDLGDDGTMPVEKRAEQLDDWQNDVRRTLEGGSGDHPALPAFADIVCATKSRTNISTR